MNKYIYIVSIIASIIIPMILIVEGLVMAAIKSTNKIAKSLLWVYAVYFILNSPSIFVTALSASDRWGYLSIVWSILAHHFIIIECNAIT